MLKVNIPGWRSWIGGLAIALIAGTAPAITIDIDYSYDTSNFFSHGNPQGSAAGEQARAALEAAADFFSTILDDSFSAIVVPPTFHSKTFDTSVSWYFNARFNHPSTGASVELSNPTIEADQYIIYAGARAYSGSTAGVGGPGGHSRGSIVSGSGTVTGAESSQLNQITSNFFDAVDRRGQISGFSRWGGTISFDNDNRNWHFNHLTAPTSGTTDFYSVAVHELAHALGFGQIDPSGQGSASWEQLLIGSVFTGSAASIEYGQFVPLHSDLAHWQEGVTSTVFGTSIVQETAMDPSIMAGTRKHFTNLDAAALTDIGWTVVSLPTLEGDYNGNGIVDAADYSIWRDTLGRSGPNLAADGDGNQVVNGADYAVWKSNFGNSGSFSNTLAQGNSTSVPEPASIILLLLVIILSASRRMCQSRT